LLHHGLQQQEAEAEPEPAAPHALYQYVVGKGSLKQLVLCF
jgi:hypothetical protein